MQQLALILVAIAFLGQNIAAAQAMTQEEINHLIRTSVWLNTDPVTAATCSNGSGPLEGSDNAEKIFNFFTKTKGYPAYIAAAFMGNMYSESGLDPTAYQPGQTGGTTPTNGIGFGLIQWTFTDRQQPLMDRARAAGVLPNDMRVQLEYIIYEISPGSPAPFNNTLEKLQATTDVVSATRIIEDHYERHLGGPQQERIDKAQEYLNTYGSGATTGGGGTIVTGCAAGGNGEQVGDLALPVARKWYEDHKDWFTKPHHDYAAADIPVPQGTPIYSMTGGKVVRAPLATASSGYGLGVEIDAGNGVFIKYGHGIDGGQLVKEGDTVTPGQLIMHSGNTGRSTGAHLHLEIDLGGSSGTNVCPQSLLVALYENKAIPAFNALPTSGCSN